MHIVNAYSECTNTDIGIFRITITNIDIDIDIDIAIDIYIDIYIINSDASTVNSVHACLKYMTCFKIKNLNIIL